MTNGMFQGPQQEVILAWLEQLGLSADSLTELTGDVSLRRYTRIEQTDGTAILATYPPEIQSSCRNFLVTTRLLTQAQVRVPQVFASDCDKGLMLLEDLGADSLYDYGSVSSTELSSYFWRATADLGRIQSIPAADVESLNPPLDRGLLWQELTQTWSTVFEPHGLVSNKQFAHALREVLEELCSLLAAETLVPCHRDFMVRNLVPVEPTPDLAVLDHQDLRLGPKHYDLASLLNDSLFPAARLEEEILASCLGDDPDERLRYHRAAAQRTLKATGTYEKFALRGFERHRKLIPGTLERALRHLRRLPEATKISAELERRMAPLLIC